MTISPPPISLPRRIALPPARQWTLSNGMPVMAIEGAARPVLRIELLFRAGRSFETAPVLGRATNLMLAEGSHQKSASDIEAFFDFYGTNLQLIRTSDWASITVYTILPHLEALLPVLAEVVTQPLFSEKELGRFIKRNLQSLREVQTDADSIADEELNFRLFGGDHPYGYRVLPSHYQRLTTGALREFHRQTYVAQNGLLLLSGQLNKKAEQLIDQYLGQIPQGQRIADLPLAEKINETGQFGIYRPKAKQTLIRQARLLPRSARQDLPGLEILNTALGNYFGSRLMQNIREEKGYTYGIESSLETAMFADYWLISADVANENLLAVRQEISRELDKLRQEPMPDSELSILRAYLIGVLIGEVDGPLNITYRYRGDILDGTPFESFHNLIEALHDMSSQEISSLAQTYLQEDEQVDLAVGGGVDPD
ncbi:MAG: pitrilysin family protein [Bacteroidota bacterium]